MYLAFICTDNSQCNGHGSCDDAGLGCDCDNDWNSLPDCSGNISSPVYKPILICFWHCLFCNLNVWQRFDILLLVKINNIQKFSLRKILLNEYILSTSICISTPLYALANKIFLSFQHSLIAVKMTSTVTTKAPALIVLAHVIMVGRDPIAV